MINESDIEHYAGQIRLGRESGRIKNSNLIRSTALAAAAHQVPESFLQVERSYWSARPVSKLDRFRKLIIDRDLDLLRRPWKEGPLCESIYNSCAAINYILRNGARSEFSEPAI